MDHSRSSGTLRYAQQIPPDPAIAQPHSFSFQTVNNARLRYFSDPCSRTSPDIAALRRPLMFQAKFGAPVNWALDIFTLPHNALRAECVDLYNILESIQLRPHHLNTKEMEEFFMWWSTFELFIIEYFDFEADLLFPWLFPHAVDDPAVRPPGSNHTRNHQLHLKSMLLVRKEPLLDSINHINGTFELRRHVDIQDVFPTLLEEVNTFVPKLLDYFQIQEQQLPPIVSNMYDASAKDALIKKYIQYIKSGEDPQMNLVLLARWMDTDVREKWIRDNMKALTRLRYPRWEKRYIREHQHIPQKFHRRLLKSIRAVAASRIRRRADFGEDIDNISFGSLSSINHGSVRSLTLSRSGRSSGKLRSRTARSKTR